LDCGVVEEILEGGVQIFRPRLDRAPMHAVEDSHRSAKLGYIIELGHHPFLNLLRELLQLL